MVEYTKFISMTRRFQWNLYGILSCCIRFHFYKSVTITDILFHIYEELIPVQLLPAVNLLNITSKFCTNVSLQLSIYKQYFIHTVQMFMMYLYTKFEVSRLNNFQFFPIRLEDTKNIYMATRCYFTLLKYIHNGYIFFKDRLQYITQDPNLHDASDIDPTSQILTYATLLLMLVGN